MKIYKVRDGSNLLYINLNRPKDNKDILDFKITYLALSFCTVLDFDVTVRDTVIVLHNTEILSFFITNIHRECQGNNGKLILTSIECYYALNLKDYARDLPIKDKDFKKALMVQELLK